MDLHPGPEKSRTFLGARHDFVPTRLAFQRNKEWYEDLVERSQDLLCIHDLEGRFLSVDLAAARLLGYSIEEMLRTPMRDFIVPEFSHAFDDYLKRIERDGEARGLLFVRTRSGERRIWEYANTLRREGTAAPIVSGIARDVTQQKRTEQLLRETNKKLLLQIEESDRTIRELKLFRTLVDRSNDSIQVLDPQTLRFLDANEKACSQLGYTRDELLSMRVYDIDSGATEESAGKITQELEQSGSVSFESVHRRKDGTTFPVELHVTRVHLDRDYAVVIARDLTESKRAENRLREYERVVEGLEEMIVVIDRDGRYVIANRAALTYQNLKKEELVGQQFGKQLAADGTSAELVEVLKQKIAECFQGKVVQFETKYCSPRLGDRFIHLSYFPIEGAKGIDRVACIVRDITERKHSEQRLREYEKVVERLDEMVSVVDRSGRCLLANRAFLAGWGIEKEHLIGRSFADQLAAAGASKEKLQFIGQKMSECLEGKVVQVEAQHGMPNLEGIRDRLITLFPIEGEGGIDRIVGISRDITERKEAEEALRRSEENYRNFISRSSEGIFQEEIGTPVSIDLPEDELIRRILYDAYIAECNDAMAAMYGLSSAEQLRGRYWKEMFPPEDPQNIEMTRQFVRSGFRLTEQESHEIDIHGNPKVFLNSAIGTVENGMLVRTWGIQRDITEKVRLEEARANAEENLRQKVAQLQQVTEELRVAKEKLTEEKLYLEESIDTELGFGEIIGRSSCLKGVLEKVAKVAPSDATVLLLGETGTGKELMARALHRLSRRQGNSFIKLNCAAIPSGLLESELFGHEKGAFTGAIARKLGRLELADTGTLFLDEIGEISLALQPKLLRVIQDQEFERLGGTQTLKVNFRLVVATNRDLQQSVKAREFRSDLYYRLNVFPIVIPPLRERREDIRPLVEHFVTMFAARMKKSITSIPSKTMEQLVRWEWPGNIRELENFVERSVILTPGSVLQAPLSELQGETENGNGNHETLGGRERERILRVLRECRGKLGGADGAAARLGLKRTTLQSKLDHLGIKPAEFRA